MSASEKTHMVVILLVVLGGFMGLGCLVLAGATLFVSSAPMAGPPPVAMATQAVSTTGSSGYNILKVTKVVPLSPGQYEVTVTDTDSNEDGEFDNYNFVVESVVTPKTTVTVKTQPKGKPLPATLETVLLVTTGKEEKKMEFAYFITKSGEAHTNKRRANLVVDLQHSKDSKEGKPVTEKTAAPK